MRSSSDDTASVEEWGDVTEPLFLEALVAEANRILAVLNAVQCQVVEQDESGACVLRVTGRNGGAPMGVISAEQLQGMANRVRELQDVLRGGI
ncbi:MAG: hypothetical protein HQL91_08160 [Magnetococcales bacterium]|nr:hypothetical protein [Magnetococcales bacterium]